MRSSKFNATVKTAKENSNITSALTYLQHFDQLSVKHFTFFGTEKQQKWVVGISNKHYRDPKNKNKNTFHIGIIIISFTGRFQLHYNVIKLW